MDPKLNFAISLVATAPDPATTGTSLGVTAGTGSLFPQPSTDGEFDAVVFPIGTQPDWSNAEMVRVTARSTDTFTITREQQDTSARAIEVGDIIMIPSMSAKDWNDIINTFSSYLAKEGGVMTGDIDMDTYSILNSYLSSPVFLGNISGWISANETWSYHSATEITVPSGAVSRYRKGMPFKLTANSVELQGYIIGIADTLLTVVGDTLTNHVFSNNYYAPAGTVPVGFDDWFAFSPVYTCEGSMTYTSTSNRLSKFKILGEIVFFQLDVAGTTGGTTSTGIYITLPVAPVSNYGRPPLIVYDTSSIGVGYGILDSTNKRILARKSDTSNWALGSGRLVCLNITYFF